MARRRNNPLALAALVTLFDEDRHPYDIAQTLKCRRHDQSMRLNFGSLYSVMKTLERNEYVEAVEVEREGRRPERTVYRITDDGVFEAQDWLADLVARPVKEYVGFEAALSLIGAMNPDDVIRLFRQRIGALKGDIAKLVAGGLPPPKHSICRDCSWWRTSTSRRSSRRNSFSSRTFLPNSAPAPFRGWTNGGSGPPPEGLTPERSPRNNFPIRRNDHHPPTSPTTTETKQRHDRNHRSHRAS